MQMPVSATRWVQMILGVICMMSISSSQYVWTLFTKPLGAALDVKLAELQITFSILIVIQTFFSPFQGFLVEKFGPRLLLSIGAILTGASWVLAAQASSITMLYATYGGLGGLGTGIIYVGVVGLMVGWFPDKRGFACGMAAAGYGFGAILTTFPIADSLAAHGYQQTLQYFGIGLGLIGLVAAQGVKAPRARNEGEAGADGVAPAMMLKTPIFWLLFLMMTMMSTSGLMVISQMASFAKDFGVTGSLVFGTAALPLALTIDRFTNGLTRPFFGFLSDRLGRENTMVIAFAGEALAMIAWFATRDNGVLFVLLSGVVFFGWGEIFSLFPSTLTDIFGEKHGTTNYGFLYMAQGIGSILGGPLAAQLHETTGSWMPVFACVICCDLLTALLAYVALKPLRRAYSAAI